MSVSYTHLEPGPGNHVMEMAPGQEGVPLADLLADEVASLNESFGLPEVITVVVADCGEPNAFYDPEQRSITMCNEYAENLQDMWEAESGFAAARGGFGRTQVVITPENLVITLAKNCTC